MPREKLVFVDPLGIEFDHMGRHDYQNIRAVFKGPKAFNGWFNAGTAGAEPQRKTSCIFCQHRIGDQLLFRLGKSKGIAGITKQGKPERFC